MKLPYQIVSMSFNIYSVLNFVLEAGSSRKVRPRIILTVVKIYILSIELDYNSISTWFDGNEYDSHISSMSLMYFLPECPTCFCWVTLATHSSYISQTNVMLKQVWFKGSAGVFAACLTDGPVNRFVPNWNLSYPILWFTVEPYGIMKTMGKV